MSCKTDLLQNGFIRVVAEADIVKAYLPGNRPADTGEIFVQFGFLIDDLQDTAGAGQPQLHQVKRENGDKGWKAEHGH